MVFIGGVRTGALVGLESMPVRAEADVASGLPHLTIVGLADTAVQEARERVRAAIRNSGFAFPNTRVTVNLAPADRKKSGSGFDLPIALAILQAQQVLPARLTSTFCVGELDLQGDVLPVDGVLPLLLKAPATIQEAIVPYGNAVEAALQHRIRIIPVRTLREAVEHLAGESVLPPYESLPSQYTEPAVAVDLSDVTGQAQAKRALEIAAAGGHNLLMSGPPGAGKTLLAQALAGILPPLDDAELLDVVSLHSIAGLVDIEQAVQQRLRPFRAPHHTSSAIALVGGGHVPQPGDVSLAHTGVLFLDELPEFPRQVLESLRQPLEDGRVRISRAEGRVLYPARCLLVAAKNPCPCGYAGSSQQRCRCSAAQIERYRSRVSGPLLDRIDLHVTVQPVPMRDLRSKQRAESSRRVRQRIIAARRLQTERLGLGRTNATLTNREIERYCGFTTEAEALLFQAADRIHLSARGFTRVQKVSRTIADLAGSERITADAIAEALLFRERTE